jgi:hypothetical protein
MTITTTGAAPPVTGHAGWFRDVRRLLDVVEVTPGLPIPYLDKHRAVFFFTGITHPAEATEAARCAEVILRSAFLAAFAPRVTEAHGVRHDILTAMLPSGLMVDLVTLGAHVKDVPPPRAGQPAEAVSGAVAALYGAVREDRDAAQAKPELAVAI